MINVDRVLPGRKVLTVGSGNVGLIVSYQLMQAGAEVTAVAEAAPRVGGYAGHEGDGISLAPVTGALMSQLLTGEEPVVPLEPLRFGRFKQGPEATSHGSS
jgi:glycine/D-amino acid oxidase-like deaminating enzyme